MGARRERPVLVPHPEEDRAPASATAGLPLLLLAMALFTASYLTSVDHLKLGPPKFPVWDLLALLGFVAIVGAAVAYALPEAREAAVSRRATERSDRARPPAVEVRPDRPIPGLPRDGRRTPPAGAAEAVPRRLPQAPTPTRANLSSPRAEAPPAPRIPAEPAPSPDEEDELRGVLDDLDGIERELVARVRPSRPA